MNQKLFVSELQVKQQTVLADNLDPKYIGPQIWFAQERYIRPILGSDLYDDLIVKFSANTMNADERKLYNDHLVPTLVNFSVAECLPLIHVKIANAGAFMRSDANIQPLSMADLTILSEKYRNQAQWHAQRMSDWLYVNATKFPLYLNGNATIDKLKPINSMYNSGIWLGQRPRQGDWRETERE